MEVKLWEGGLQSQEIKAINIVIELGANAQSGGSGKTGVAALPKLSAAPSGGGEGDATAGVRIVIEPVGYLRAGANGPEFVRLD